MLSVEAVQLVAIDVLVEPVLAKLVGAVGAVVSLRIAVFMSAADLAGGERAVVDADLVDHAVEEAARRGAVGADPPPVGVADVAGEGLAGDQRAVDVELGRRAVVGGGEVLPGADRRRLCVESR